MCTVCEDTGEYINAQGVYSGQPCHVCRPEAFYIMIGKEYIFQDELTR